MQLVQVQFNYAGWALPVVERRQPIEVVGTA